jgi:hypothetical protein
MRAMAELGAGPHRSGDIAEILGKKVTTVAPTRNALIAQCASILARQSPGGS